MRRSSFVELLVELVFGALTVGVGFAALWILRGRSGFDASANEAWTVGFIVVFGGVVGFLVMRGIIRKRTRP